MKFVKVFKGQDQWVFFTSVTPEDLSRTTNQWQIILSALQPHSFLYANNFCLFSKGDILHENSSDCCVKWFLLSG